MSEIREAKARAEIIVMHLKSRKITTLTGRYGLFYECYGLCVTKGYALLSYKAIYA